MFEFRNKNYLVTVDYYSNFFEVDRLYKTTSKHVIQKLRVQFSRHGIPSKVISDNGPQFSSSDFADFAKTYEFVHVTSSPGYPQSNGKAENAVKTVKRIMKKSLKSGEDPFLALLSWRYTPSEGMNSSPVQRLYGRRTRTLLPTTNKFLKPKIATHVKKEMTVRKNKQKQYYDRNTKPLNDLEKGDIVRIRSQGRENEWKKGIVEEKVNINSYNVKTEDGGIYRRNRRHLRSSKEQFELNDPNVEMKDNDRQDDSCVRSNETSCENTEHSLVQVAPRRSGRVRREPSYLKDYVMK